MSFNYSCIFISLAFTVFDDLNISGTIAMKIERAHAATVEATTTWPPIKSK